ncbi:MAG: hypothetical protein ABIH40_03670 [Candidatus Omnitrophota bacterium]
MSFEQGGMADKLGNRYEGRWVARQLLSLLNEKISSVTIEAIGDDERGVDLWVQQNDGTREAQQCKARNANKESWSVVDLKNRGVLQNLKFQLSRDPNYKFVFISSVGSRIFADICEFSRRANDEPELFYKVKIKQSGYDMQTCFQNFCEALTLNPDSEDELKQIFNYLKKTYVEIYSDDQGTYKYLLERIDYLLVGGSAETILSVLLTYAENKNKLGSPIYADELRNYLIQQNIHPRRLDQDTRITPVIQELQNQFEDSIKPYLIRGAIIKRPETDRLIKSIEDGKNVILSGAAGYGKSGVLFELTEHLKQKGTPYLPIRLDRKSPENTSVQFGKSMDLPDCPAFSLAGISGERQSVLILDQLDAIRWTSVHSNNALDVCKELVRHIQFLQRDGKKITVVLSCRTFDLEHDPSIKNWLGDSKKEVFDKIEIKELSGDKLKELVGPEFAQMTTKEKSLLACAQNLAIWMELKRAGSVPSFQTATGLMREFWKNRRIKLINEAHITSEEIEQVLSILIRHIESNGKISVPERIVLSWPNVIDAFCSYGILQKSSGMINFCHQRYLDHLIANNLLTQIAEGTGNVVDWLGTKMKQSLFRREQLRQALVMMSEESPDRFLQSAQQILVSNAVRFHIKHLVLEIIGSQEDISDELGQYCLDLFCVAFWQTHILETVFGRHPVFVTYLGNKGIIRKWCESGESGLINQVLWLLRSVAERTPDFVAEILEPYINKSGEWPEHILKTISWNAVDDSDRMFSLRLKLVRMGVIGDFVDWKSLSIKFPLRVVQLIEAVVSAWNIDDSEIERKNRMNQWYEHDKNEFKHVAEKCSKETWDYFIPHIVRLTNFIDNDGKRLEKWRKERFSSYEHINIARGIVELLIVAGQCLANNDADALIERTKLLKDSRSPIIQEIIIQVYKKLPPKYAEVGIRWLLEDVSRFCIKSGYDEPEWKLAAELIEALSSYCSEELFQRLEETIVNYHSPDEKHLAKFYLSSWRRGYYGYYWGGAQHFLLPTLFNKRIKKTTRDLIGVLRRKFSPEDRFFNRNRMSGGWVGSKIDPNLNKISDRAWLDIISSPKVGERHGHNWKQVDSEHVLEASIEQFSRSLQKIANRFPERFCRLALKFPDNVDSSYVAAILSAGVLKTPDTNIPDEEKDTWRPAGVESIESILNKFKIDDDRETAMVFCRIISARPEEKWSDKTLARLIHYAINHPDLEKGKLNVYCDKTVDEASVENLYQNTINCVRGVAAEAIRHLLWESHELFQKLRPGIESLVQDNHPSVRMAVIQIMLPMINFDKDLAVKWFCKSCDDDLRVAASPHAQHFFNYTIQSHFKDIAPIIQRMLISPSDEVAKEGAAQITARWLFYGFFEDELLRCQSGTIIHRQGVASVASHFLHDEKYSEKCQNLLRPLLNDPEKEVRDEIHSPFYKKGSLNDSKIQPFILEYINSKTFADDPDRLVYELEDMEGSVLFLADTIFAMYNMFSSVLKEDSRSIGSHFPHAISQSLPILLRLYEQALGGNSDEIANRCLDTWDMLFQNRVGFIQDLTKAIEQ